jgi:hypothetical protein
VTYEQQKRAATVLLVGYSHLSGAERRANIERSR